MQLKKFDSSVNLIEQSLQKPGLVASSPAKPYYECSFMDLSNYRSNYIFILDNNKSNLSHLHDPHLPSTATDWSSF